MTVTIDREAKINIIQPIDLDNYSERFKTENGLYVFTEPWLWILQKDMFFLLKDAVEEDFEQKYKYRPDYLSFDKYGTVILAPILMYVNDVFNIEEFDLDTVIIPSYGAIVTITQERYPKKKTPDELNSVGW